MSQWLVARVLLVATLLAIGWLTMTRIGGAELLSARTLEQGLGVFADARLIVMLLTAVVGAAVAQSTTNWITPTPRAAVPGKP
jgi:hypothetical protein